MFCVIRGSAKAYDTNKDGGIFLSTLKAGSFFGEIALVLNERRSATVVALSSADLLVMRKNDLYRVILCGKQGSIGPASSPP